MIRQDTSAALVIHSDPNVCYQISETLWQFFTQVECQEHLPVPNENIPVLLVLDHTLPFQAWSAYQRHGSAVLVVIPEGDQAALNRVLESGADDYITYPLNERALVHRVQQMISTVRNRADHEYQRRYQELFTYHQDAMYLHDMEGHLLEANNALLELIGYERDALPDLSIWEIMEPDQTEWLRRVMKDFPRQGLPRRPVELILKRKDGSLFPIEVRASLVWRNDEPWAIQGIANDITERKRTLQRLEQAEKRYRLVANLTANHTYANLVMPDGTNVREWGDSESVQALVGYSYDEIDAMGGWMNLVHPDDLELAKAHRVSIANGETAITDYRILTADKTVKWLREYSQTEMDDGRITRVYGAVQDITNLKTVENADFVHRALIDAIQDTAVSLNSTLDFNTILDRILTRLAEVLDYDLADVMLVEDDMARIVRHRGYIENGMEAVVSNVRMPIATFATLDTMATTQKSLIIDDVRQYPGWNFDILEQAEKIERAYLGVPLFVNEQLAGFVNLNSRHPGNYTAYHARLLEVFASQVSIAIANAQLHNTVLRHSIELEQRIRDLIAVYEIGQALTSLLNLREIYQLLYEEVAKLLYNAPQMRISLYDEKTDSIRYDFVIDQGDVKDPDKMQLTASESKVLRQVIRNREVLKSGNTVYEPLISRRNVIGVLQIVHHEDYNFDEVDVTLLATLANLAAIAVENAQLYQMVHIQRNEMTALYQATTILFVSDSMEDLARQITDTIVEKLNPSDCGLILFDQGGLVRVARSGRYAIDPLVPLHLQGGGLVPEAIRTRQMIYSPDVTADPRYIAGDSRTRSELVIPLCTARDVLGVLDFQSAEVDAFPERDRRILQAYAERVTAAIENMQLIEQIRSYNTELEQRVAERTDELRQALDQERRLGEMKTRFVMTVSHQFRTPLTAIQSAKEMLMNYGHKMEPDQRTQRYEKIDQSVAEIVRLLEDTLMVNSLTENQIAYNPVLVDLDSLTQGIIEDFSSRFGKTHRIFYASDEVGAFNIVDSEMWRKIVVELLTNAVKFSNPQSRIDCKLSATGGECLFIVKDEGIGIPAEDIDRIFGIFDRGENVENIPGAGLGLAIVKQTMERHQGTVEIISEMGKGTTVTLRLPKYVLEGVR